MFSIIRGKLALIIASLFAAGAVLIKLLMWKNKKSAEKITALEQEAETQDMIHEADIKRVKFEAEQSEKASRANDESGLDSLDTKRGVVTKDDKYTSITR